MNPANQNNETAQTPLPPAPLYQDECYYFPKPGISLATQGRVFLYPGWLIMMDVKSDQEAYRVALTPQLKIQTVLSVSQFTTLNGQKLSVTEKRKYTFYRTNPSSPINSLLYIISALSSRKRKRNKQFTTACYQAAGITNR